MGKLVIYKMECKNRNICSWRWTNIFSVIKGIIDHYVSWILQKSCNNSKRLCGIHVHCEDTWERSNVKHIHVKVDIWVDCCLNEGCIKVEPEALPDAGLARCREHIISCQKAIIMQTKCVVSDECLDKWIIPKLVVMHHFLPVLKSKTCRPEDLCRSCLRPLRCRGIIRTQHLWFNEYEWFIF